MTKSTSHIISDNTSLSFEDFNLNPLILNALQQVGYTTPSPIQAEIIPHLMQGKDVIGQAQTGTGKTAAFALPILNSIDVSFYAEDNRPQALVLAPTRELAIQVADSFRKYSAGLKNISVATICGGQEYGPQLRQLKNGVNIVVGTPGRIMDHIERSSLDISNIKTFVLDEADEMLRMGFIEDIDWILEHAPEQKQIALFSATMPKAIRNIAVKYLKNPVKVTIEPQTETSNLISQYYIPVNFPEKTKMLKRILEIYKNSSMDNISGVIVFARTKMDTIAICEDLLTSGYKAVALNGDIDQKQRERTIKDLKQGDVDILVATDVAARGLHVDRITHVLNYDMPHDSETYMHRIGRTGRAGKSGTAISFVTKSERHNIRNIENFSKIKITPYQMPSLKDLNEQRVKVFQGKILKILNKSSNTLNHAEELQKIVDILQNISDNSDYTGYQVGAAAVKLLYEKSPLLLTEADLITTNNFVEDRGSNRSSDNNRSGRGRFDSNRSDRGRSDRGRSDRSRFDSTRSDSNRSNERRSDRSRFDSTRADSNRSEERRSDRSRFDSTRADSNRSEERRSDRSRFDSTRADSNRSEERRSDRSRFDNKTPNRSDRSDRTDGKKFDRGFSNKANHSNNKPRRDDKKQFSDRHSKKAK